MNIHFLEVFFKRIEVEREILVHAKQIATNTFVSAARSEKEV